MLVPLEIPPGVYRNGTDLQAQGRWHDISLVRWKDGAMQPIGGWRERMDFTSGKYRGALAWQDNSGDRWLAVGSHNKLKVSTRAGVVTDITPAGLTAGDVNAMENVGYGGGPYGVDAYGVTRSSGGTYQEATTWAMDAWGEYLLACSSADGKIYEWQLDTGTPAAAVSGAPTGCLGVLVTPERFVFALGAGGNPKLVQWSDREDNTEWTPAATNEAGSQALDAVGQIMCGINVPGQTLILTDHEAFVASYVGPPFVYGFRNVGAACGVASRKAVALTSGGALWMGAESFYGYFGGAVEAVPCDVSDYVFNDMNRSQISKVFAVSNGQFGEVWWFYPSSSSGECDKYVVYNYQERHWLIGDMARTTGVDRGTMDYPILVGTDAVGYDHEIGLDYAGATIRAETGPIVLSGDVVTAIEFHPDEATRGDVQVTFKTRNYPNGTESDHGPYAAATPTNVRFTGRQIRMLVEGARLADWRWGIPRLQVNQRGRR